MSPYMRELRARVGTRLLEIPSVSVLIFDPSDRVLLARHRDLDVWTTPGGAVDPEESPADAALREVWEETGLRVELLGVLGVYGGPRFTTTYPNGDVVSFMMVVFEGRAVGGALHPDGEEIVATRYFARAELDEVRVQPWVPEVIDDALGSRRRTHFDAPSWRPPASPD